MLMQHTTNPRRRGLSLVEALMSMILVAGLVVASLDLFGANAQAGQSMNRGARAQLLAQSLMSEILGTAYVEPSGVSVLFGPEIGEPDLIEGSRLEFDDVDDYNGLNESPPKRRDGTAIPGATGWRRKVEVRYVQSANLATGSVTDQSVKRVTVWVCWNAATCGGAAPNNALATLVAVRTNSPMSESEKDLLDIIIEILPIQIK